MNSTLRLLIVALAMLGAFLIGASSGAGTWAPVGVRADSSFAASVNTRTGQFCWSYPLGPTVKLTCSEEAK